MTDQVILNLPDDIAARAREIAEMTSQPFEQVLIDHLQSLQIHAPPLSTAIQSELDALKYLSTDALYTIAQEQIPPDVQTQVNELMAKRAQSVLTESEHKMLEEYIERADRLMLRKAEAALLLKSRGEDFSQKDFVRTDER